MPGGPTIASRALWLLRGVWLVAPIVAAPAFTNALGEHSTPVAVVGAVLLWVSWAAVLLATLVPRTVSLTAVRLGAAGAVVAAAGAFAGTSRPAGAAALAWAVVTLVVALSAPVADALVDGSSYGPERRLLLRTPGLLLLGPAELAAVVAPVAVAAGPLLLAARSWLLGAVALLVGWPAAAVCARALHQLSRRWIVFVPGGVVLHDRVALAEPMLFPRALVDSLGAAAPDTDATDVTAGAMGLVLELRLRQPVDIVVRDARRGASKVDTERVSFTPARPGTVLSEARARRLPVA
jgi:hypothetical protein